MLTDDGELGVRDVHAAAASAKPSQEVPGRVPVQDLPSLGGGVGGDEIVHVPFEADHLLVALRQGAGGHEHAADVLDDLSFRESVQGLVRQGPTAGAEIGQNGGDDAAGEPAHRGAGSFGAGQGVVESLQLGGYGSRVVGEEFVEPLLERAARTRTRSVQPFGFTADGTRAPELGVRCGAGAADRCFGGAGVDATEPPAGGAVRLASVAAAAAGQAGQAGVGCRVRCVRRSSRAGQAGDNSWGREGRQRCGSVLVDACRS
jgi:hypothetical protein